MLCRYRHNTHASGHARRLNCFAEAEGDRVEKYSFEELVAEFGAAFLCGFAAGAAGLLLGVREILHRRWFNLGGDRRTFLLLCPNLTLVALAAKAMSDHGADPKLTAWLVLTGLLMTIPSLLLLPAGEESVPLAASPASAPPAGTITARPH